MKTIILVTFLSLIFSLEVFAEKAFLEFGTGNEINTGDGTTLEDIKAKYGDRDWREVQYNPATHGKVNNTSTGVYGVYSLADKAAAKQLAMEAKAADKAAIKQKYATIFGLTKEQMDEFAEALK